MKTITIANLPLSYIGPELGKDAKTVFYFSLSAKDSLSTSPFYHPAKMLQEMGFRVISTTLPFHEQDERPTNIKDLWGTHKAKLLEFFAQLEECIRELSLEIGVAGLSRGAFVAMHMAARLPQIKAVLGFAPMCHIEHHNEMDLLRLAPQLTEKRIRFHIGHKDTLVGTERAIETIAACIDAANHSGTRNPPMEIIIKPSVGRDGHGTLDPVFLEGCTWLNNHL